LDHRLPPGTKLVEDRLATRIGVSRTRIRPVLVRLANEQIVVLTPDRGCRRRPNATEEKEAREVFEVRRMMRPTLIGCFIDQASAVDISVLADCIAAEAARASGDTRRAIRCRGTSPSACKRHRTTRPWARCCVVGVGAPRSF